MTPLPEFALETLFAKWEFSARHHLTASDAQTMRLPELLALAQPDQRMAFENLALGYSETWGAPDVRDAVAATFASRSASDVLCTAGAEEGIYAAITTMLRPEDHAIVVIPGYQSMQTVSSGICSVTGIPLDASDDWSLDVDRVARAIRSNTRLIMINFPHNPTGTILSADRFAALIDLCRRRGIHLFSDEVYRPLGPIDAVHLPQVADLYELGISLGVTSKAYGLPGLRIGWLVSQDRGLLQRIERTKHYLSICNAGPSERLTVIALKARETILRRNCRIVTENLQIMDRFFAERPDLFEWRRPDGACVGYPRYLGADGVETFARRLVEESGVFVAPASVFASTLGQTPTDRFRIGFGRDGLLDGLQAFRNHLERCYPSPR